MSEKYTALTDDDISQLSTLINARLNLFLADVPAALFISILLWIMYFIGDKVLSLFFLCFALIPAFFLLFSFVLFRVSTKKMRADLKSGNKVEIRSKVEDVGSLTYGFTIPFTHSYVHKTIYKKFDFFVKAEDHQFITKDENTIKPFKRGDRIVLEVAEESGHVFGIKK